MVRETIAIMNSSSIRRAVRFIVSSVLVAGFLTSCVSTKNVALSSADKAVMRGKTVTVTHREKPHHWVMKQSAMAAASLGGAVGGAIAGAVAEKEGAEQIRIHQIGDPNLTLSKACEKDLLSKTGLKPVASRGTTTSLDPKEVAAQNAHADYVLDCFTTAWFGTYYPFSIGKYFMIYAAKMQLIETSTGRVVAEGFSNYQGKDRANAPDYDGIYSNGAAFLKSETKTGTDMAIGTFTKQF